MERQLLGPGGATAANQAVIQALLEAGITVNSRITDENGAAYSDSNRLRVSVGDLTIENLQTTFPDSVVDANNSTVVPLDAGGVFAGPAVEALQFAEISVYIYTDQPSATNGAELYFSDDGVVWGPPTAVSIPAGVPLTFKFSGNTRFFKLRYENGATAQGVFHAQTILHYNVTAQAQVPIAAQTTDLFSATNTQAHLKARVSQGPFTGLWFPLSVGQQARTGSLGVTLSAEDMAALAPLLTLGEVGDAAVVTDTTGTLSGKLRGLVKWAYERMPASLGQTTKALSFPVTLASDQDALGVTGTFFPPTQTVAGSVGVSNFPADQKVHDDYQGGEVLPDQNGAGAVLTFTFSAAVQMVVMQSTGASLVARGDPFGGTPSASLGIRLEDGVPTYVPVNTTSVKVFAPAGTSISVYGMRRA